MVKDDIEKFIKEVKWRHIRQESWTAEAWFMPDGTFEFDPKRGIVKMSGTMHTDQIGRHLVDLPVNEGFDRSGFIEPYEYTGEQKRKNKQAKSWQANVSHNPIIEKDKLYVGTPSKVGKGWPLGFTITLKDCDGNTCSKCKGVNTRSTTAGFLKTVDIMWCDDCKDEF